MAQERYFNFDEYKKNGTPEQKKRAENWGIAIGLQAVDGLRVSDFLLELARKNIEGELTMEEVNEMLDKHYKELRERKAAWKEYETYTRLDTHPDPEAAKRGRPI